MSEQNKEALDPFTGLPISEKPTKENTFTNPFTGQQQVITAPRAPLPTPQIGVGANYMDPINRYQKYNVPLRRQFDWNEERARRQTTSEKWKNGLAKAFVTTVGSITDSTLGLLAGIGTAAHQQEWSGLYDNPVGNAIDGMNEWMQENYPNYYTKAEQEAQGLAALGYANFWADKAMNGLGYAVASVATVVGTGGAGLVTRGMSAGTKALRLYRASSMMAKGMGKTAAARQAISSTAALGKATRIAQATEIGAMLAYGESAVEAREILNTATQALMEERAAELGIRPDQLSAADLAEIRDVASHAANVGFSLNMAVLSASNLVAFNKILFPKYLNTRSQIKGMKFDTKLGKFVDKFKDDPLWKRTIKRYGSVPAMNAMTETFQEGTQFAIQDASVNMAKKDYNDIQASWTESLYDGYSATFNTKEGIDSMMLGFIVGGLMGGGQSMVQRFKKGSEDKVRAQVLAALNNPNFLNTIDRANATAEQLELANVMDTALQEGDHKTYRDAQFKLIASSIAMYDKAGALDLFEAKLKDAENMSDEDFREFIGAPEGTKVDKKAIVQGIRDKVKEYEIHKNRVDTAVPSMPTMGVPKLFMSKEKRAEEAERLRDEQQLKDLMVRKAMQLEDADSRIDQLSNELNTMRAEASQKVDQEEGALTSEELRATAKPATKVTQVGPLSLVEEEEQLSKETINKIDQIVKDIEEANPAKGMEAREKAKDLKRLARDRGVYINATRELFGDPSQRTAYFERQKQVERRKLQEEAVQRVREEMGKTTSSKELIGLIEGLEMETITPEFAEELTQELTKREQAEGKLREDYRRMTTEELKQEYEKESVKEEPNQMVLDVLKEEIDRRTEAGIDGAEATQATEDQLRDAEKAAAEDAQRAADEEAAAMKAEQEAERSSQSPTDVTNEETEPFTVVTANGEFQLGPGFKVVFSNGKPNEGNLAASSGINRTATKAEGLEGQDVTFKLVQTADNFEAIGIFLQDGTQIGVVAATRQGQPRPEFQRLLELVRKKGEVEGTVKKRFFVGKGNVLNETDPSGAPIMKPVSEAFPNKPSGFVGYAVRTRTGLKYAFPLAEQSEETQALVTQQLASRAESYDRITPGQVGVIVRLPNGEITLLPISTQKLGAEGAQLVLDELAKGDINALERIRDLAGIRRTYGEPMKFTIDVVNGKFLINIKIDSTTAVSLEAEELFKFLNGGGGRFRIGSFEETTNKEGERETKFIPRKENPSKEEFMQLSDQIGPLFAQYLADTKRQFDVELGEIDEYGGQYLSPYTAKTYDSYIEYAEAELLQTDIRPADETNSPFFDVQISFTVQGMTAEDAVDTKPMPVDTTNNPTVEVEEKATDGEPGTRHNEDDLFGEESEDELRVDPETGQAYDEEDIAFRLGRRASKKINKDKAIKYLTERFGKDAVVIFDKLQMVGDNVVHGYMENAAVYLWQNAEVGTEYHEAFHLFFRTLLNDKQRTALYNDAVKIYGEPTAEQIAAARRGQEGISAQEAKFLALEERMAEEFREYNITEEAPKSLGRRIIKFFADLLAYIKALSTDRLTVRQAFRLIESNRIPAQFSRTAAKFSPGKAFMMKEYALNQKLHREMQDLILLRGLEALEGSESSVEAIMGTNSNPELGSPVRDWFLRYSVHKPNGTALTAGEFLKFQRAYESSTQEARQFILDNNLKSGAPELDSNGVPFPAQMVRAAVNGKRFRVIYDNWYDQQGELGGVAMRGFLSEVSDRLKREFGYKLQDTEGLDAEAEFERIYERSRQEEDPAKKMSAKAKRVLARIPVEKGSSSYFGFRTYLPAEEVFREVAGIVHDSPNLQVFLQKLKEKQNSISTLKAVYNKINSMNAQEQALVYSTLSMSMADFVTVTMETTADLESGENTIKVRIFSPNSGSIDKYYGEKWSLGAISEGGVYFLEVNEDGDVLSTQVAQDRAKRIQNYADIIENSIDSPTRETYLAMADMMWDMGIELAANKQEARRRLEVAFTEYGLNVRSFLKEDTRLLEIARKKFAPDMGNYGNIFTTETSTIRAISKLIMTKFEGPKAQSFLNAAGNTTYPINLKSDFDITASLVQTGEYARMMNNTAGHQAGSIKSLALLLAENKMFREMFAPKDFDGLRSILSDTNTDLSVYKSMTYEQALKLSLALFANPNANGTQSDIAYIAIDTQADRSRLTYLPIPKWWMSEKTRRKYGLQSLGTSPTREIIKNSVMIDLHRMHITARSKMSGSEELMTYHTRERWKAFQLSDRATYDSEQVEETAKAVYEHLENGQPLTPEVGKAIDFLVDAVIEEEVYDGYLDIVEALGGEEKAAAWVRQNVPTGSYIKGQELAFLESFVETDVLGRYMSREILRSGVNYVKDGADYNKRSGHSSVPGNVPLIQGETTDTANQGYGMPSEIHEITISDLETSLQAPQLMRLVTALASTVGRERAEEIVYGKDGRSGYTRINGTDAQGLITPTFYRHIMMGYGLWDMNVHEPVYRAWKDEGKPWDGEVVPLPGMKTSYEFRMKHEVKMGDKTHTLLIPVAHKNSYVVLTEELVEGNPILTNLLNRMELRGPYADPNNMLSQLGLEPIHIANTESAKKLTGYSPVDVQDLEGMSSVRVHKLDPRGFKIPQFIPDKKAQTMTFGRQPRKNMIANINPNTQYMIPGMDRPISGRELVEIYQNAVVAKLRLNENKVLKRLGYDKVIAATTVKERIDAMEALLPKLRDLLHDLGVEKDYPQNLLDALELRKNEDGNLVTKVPLAFPSVQSKLEQLLFGLFRKDVYQQKMAGMEMIQFAEFGGTETDGSLKFYDVVDGVVQPAEVDIRVDVLERMGIDPEQSLDEVNEQLRRMLGYRIPQQGKSSMLYFRVRNVLPKSHKKAIKVPAAITVQMGSDFDIDKLFVIFPEVERNEAGETVRSETNWGTLKSEEAFSELSEKQLNNIIFDTFAAISSNVAHLHETIAPLDISDLEEAREQIGQSKPVISLVNSSTRLQTGVDNMLSGILRGLYANGIAGRNVAVTADVIFSDAPIVVDGTTLGTIVENSPFTGVPTDQYLSQYLSAAVDSVKDPIQSQINDNAVTAPLTTYMISIGMTPQQAIAFLNLPGVKKKTDIALSTGQRLTKVLGNIEPVAHPLNTAEMLKLIEEGSLEKQGMYNEVLSFMAIQAQALDNLYRVLTPDAIDKAGTVAQNQARIDRGESLEGDTYGGLDALEQITKGNAYPIVREYYRVVRGALELGGNIGFLSDQLAVTQFKNSLKAMTGRRSLTEAMHRDINRAILHHLVTRKGSPIEQSGILSESNVQNFHILGGAAKMFDIVREHYAGTYNIVADSLELRTEKFGEDTEFTYLQVDTNKLGSAELKDQWTYTLQAMERDDALHKKLKEAGIDLSVGESFLMNSVTTSGFAPAPTAYFAMFPTDLLVNGTRNTNLDVSAHLENEMKRLDQDNYLNDFLPSFITNYGTHKFGGAFLFADPINSVGESFEAGERRSQYVVGQYKKRVVLYERKGNQYVRIPTLGKQYTFYEHNVLDSNGNQVHSLVGDTKTNQTRANSTASQSRLATGQKIDRGTAQEQIQKLREAFARVGANVRVVEAPLPQGVKGQVEGNIITIDPNQMEADTVYHEFGHILVDMLPPDQRDRFIAQVKKARPDLANSVAAKYPELSPEDLGKEILVTAIGIEGAKIERRQPNLLQRIINKIMRALGKVFGISPDAAAVIAEQMFAGDIRSEGLSLKFNPALQRSKILDAQIDQVYKDVKDSLIRQLKRLRSYPESEQTDKRKLEIKTLIKNLDKIKRTKQDIDAFFDFQQYVVARVVEMQDIMATIKGRQNRPLTKEEKLETLRMHMDMKQILDSLYDVRESKSNVVKLTRLLRRMDFNDAQSDDARAVMFDLQDAVYDLSELYREYNEVMLPLVADVLVTYVDPNVNDEIDQLIEQTIREKDISGWQVYSTFNTRPEFIAIIKKYKAEFNPMFGRLMLSKEFRSPEVQQRFRDEMLEAKLNWLKSRRAGRDQILQELQDANTDKSYFSYMMDPAVYDSEANIQLFAAVLKDAINNSNESTRKHLFNLQPLYDAYKNLMGSDFNESKFNDQLLTTVRVPIGDGKYEEVLALVQEYDVDSFYKNMESAMRALNKQFNKPEKTASKLDMKNWRYSPEGLKHRRAVIRWYKENTVPVEGAKEAIENMNARIAEVQAQLNAIDKDKNRDQFNLLLNQLQDLKDKKYANVTKYGQFIGDLVRPNDSYKNKKWQDIQNNPVLKAYYEFNRDAFFQAQKKIGRSQLFVNRWDKFSYIMPSVRQDGLGLLQQEGWKGFATEQVEDWKRLETDTEFGMWTQEDGDPVKSIPRFYTNPVNHKKVSKDVASSITQFVHMANNFEEKSKVTGLVESMLSLHEQRGVLQLDETGRPIVDNLAKMSRQAIEYVTKQGGTGNRYKFLQEFVDVNFYGQVNLNDALRLPGGVSFQKLASKAASVTAIANLSFNMLQIGNQFILDNLMGTEEAFAGQFFTKADLAWAAKTYAAEGGAMSDLGKFVPRTKLGQAFQAFDAMNDISDELGRKLSSSAAKKLAQSNPLMAPQYAVEHQTVGVRMLALMNSIKALDKNGKPILNEDGSEATLWDMFVPDEKGMYAIDPRVANMDRNRFIAKLHGINRRANQIKGTFDRGMAERRGIGRLALLFRKYFVPGLRKRFGHGSPFQVDYELGSVTRGMYFSLVDYLGQIPNRGVFGAYGSMNQVDKQNMKRVAYEMAALATTMTIFNVLMGMIDMDDDDEDSYWTVFAAYQARRLQTELLQFVSPGEFIHMAKAPMATTNYVDKYLTVMNQLFINYPAYYMGMADESAIYYQRRTGSAEKGDPKIVNQTKKIIPIMNGWQSSWFGDNSVDVVKQKLRWFAQ